ncbi:MAG: hypothetical protein IJX27_05275 [Clostridia bacterium]|nr:hypothetical protein [Clostridia bacterium]
MDNIYGAPRRVSVLPLAVLQVAASLLLALSVRTGFLHVGVFLVAVATAMFALQSIVSGSYLYFATVALSVCGAFLIGGVFPAAMSLFALPAGLIMAHMVKKKSTKMSVTVVLDVLYAVLFAGLFLAVYLLGGNEFSLSAIITYFSDIVEVLKEAFIKNIEAEEETLTTFMNMLGAKDGETFAAMIDAVFETFKLILPAIIISTMGVIAYFTAAVFKLGTAIANCELVLPDPKWATLPSKASAVIYSVAYIIYSAVAMFSSEMNVFLLVCYSIVIVLTPVMLLMGIKWIKTLRNKGMVIVLFIFGSMFMPSLAVMILAFFGVREVFLCHDRKKENEKNDDREI